MASADAIQRKSKYPAEFVVVWLDSYDGKTRWLVNSSYLEPDKVLEYLETIQKRYEIPELMVVFVFSRELAIGEAIAAVERISTAGYRIESMYSADSNEFGQSFFPARYVPVSIGAPLRKKVSE